MAAVPCPGAMSAARFLSPLLAVLASCSPPPTPFRSARTSVSLLCVSHRVNDCRGNRKDTASSLRWALAGVGPQSGPVR